MGGTSEKCVCHGKPAVIVRAKRMEKIEVFPPTVFCGKIELIVTLKTGIQKCLDTEGKQGKRLLRRIGQQKRRKQKQTRELRKRF